MRIFNLKIVSFLIINVFFLLILTSIFTLTTYAQGAKCSSLGYQGCNTLGAFKRKCFSGTRNCSYYVWRCEDIGNGTGPLCFVPYNSGSESSCEIASSDPDTQDCSRPSGGGTVDEPGDIQKTFGEIPVPEPIRRIGFGAGGISNFLSTLITLIYIFASLIFIFMIVWGAFQWIISGGDKEAVANARKRITHAIIGIFILALSFVIIGIIGYVTGFEFFRGQEAGFRFQQRQSELEKMRREFKNAPESAE